MTETKRRHARFVSRVRIQPGYPLLITQGPMAGTTGTAHRRNERGWRVYCSAGTTQHINRQDLVTKGDILRLDDLSHHTVTLEEVTSDVGQWIPYRIDPDSV